MAVIGSGGGLKGSLQGVARIMKVVQNKAVNAIRATLENTVDRMVADIDHYWRLQYKGVTGNAYTSVTAGVYYKGKLVHIANSGDGKKQPTRKSLTRGRTYNLPEYYDGDAVVGKPFTGTEGYISGNGPTMGKAYMKSNHPAKRKTWVVLIAMPMPYAEYHPGLVHTMQSMLDALPQEIDRNIVYVENAPTQSELPF